MLRELTDKLREQTGFEVFQFGRIEGISDFDDSMDCYTRAVHNLRNPEKGYDTTIQRATRIYTGGDTSSVKDFNVASYGLLPKKTETFKDTYEQVKRKGLPGLLGLKKTISAGQRVSRTDFKDSQPLSDIITVDSDLPAHFTRFTFKTNIRDKSGRPCSNPSFTMICDEGLMKQTIKYLKDHPQEYLEFLEQMLPRSKYPNVRKGILDKADEIKKILFLKAEKVPTSTHETRNGWELHKGIYERYGETVSVA